ncbi:hypothetical protein EH228_04160 [Erwinia endophytica]|uniref:fimbrial protein n=1 Tax=Erwinia endophytica TaxID=1563158 RepID=UPI001265FAAB|nr:fimbrial protein [Erwinia endophytica]KAB8313329.1 hypothetical protein EH228_04160 [Erwinia endophytica]
MKRMSVAMAKSRRHAGPLRILVLLALMVNGFLTGAQAETKLTVKGNLQQMSCDVELVTPASIAMGVFLSRDFQDNNGTAAISNITVKVHNCENVDPKKGSVGLQVSGSTLKDKPYIFNDNSAGDAGFMLRENDVAQGPHNQVLVWNGPLDTFFAIDEAVKDGDVTFGNDDLDPTVQEGVLLNYGIGFVAASPDTLPTASTTPVTASLTFTFNYR